MANADLANEPTHCPDCGASFALVGRGTHATMCRARLEPKPAPVAVLPAAPKKSRAPSAPVKVAGAEVGPAATYKYRDPEKRREYMKGYMARKRAKGGK